MPVNGVDKSSGAGGGFVGGNSWISHRTISWIDGRSFTGTITKLSTLNMTTHSTSNSGQSGVPVNSVAWQMRMNSSAPTYANRKTSGTLMFMGTGNYENLYGNLPGISALNTYNISATTAGATRYMWFCEQ